MGRALNIYVDGGFRVRVSMTTSPQLHNAPRAAKVECQLIRVRRFAGIKRERS